LSSLFFHLFTPHICKQLFLKIVSNKLRRLEVTRGYIGKILWVNLSYGELKDEVLDEKL